MTRRFGIVPVLAAVLLASALFAACDGDEPSAPEGFAFAEVGPASFVYPEDWTRAADDELPEGMTRRFQGPASEGDVHATVDVFISDSEREDDSFQRVTANISAARNTLVGYEMLSNDETDVPGAEGNAYLLVYHYQSDAGELVVVHDVYAERGGTDVVVRVNNIEDLLDDATVDTIVDSVTLR